MCWATFGSPCLYTNPIQICHHPSCLVREAIDAPDGTNIDRIRRKPDEFGQKCLGFHSLIPALRIKSAPFRQPVCRRSEEKCAGSEASHRRSTGHSLAVGKPLDKSLKKENSIKCIFFICRSLTQAFKYRPSKLNKEIKIDLRRLRSPNLIGYRNPAKVGVVKSSKTFLHSF